LNKSDDAGFYSNPIVIRDCESWLERGMEYVRVFGYLSRPFRLEPLLLVVIFSLLLSYAVGGTLVDIRHGVLGIPIIAVIGSWFFKYAFMLLDHVAQGRPNSPVMSAEAANLFGEMRPLGYLFAMAVFFGMTVALRRFIGTGIALGITELVRCVALILLPAVVAIHTITGSVVEALNPRVIVGMIWRIGYDYLWLLLGSVACWVAGWQVVAHGGQLILVLRIALLMLLWLMQFALLGGVVYERRHELGYEAEYSPERTQLRNDAERDRVRNQFVARLFGEYRAGAYLNTWNSIQHHAQAVAKPIEEYRWIYDRIETWPNPQLANRMAQEMLPLLLASRHNSEALKLTKGRLQVDADFRPTTVDQLIRLVHLARDGGDRPLARALLQDFDRLFPNDAARRDVLAISASLVDPVRSKN
jgi:hypothetical protein